MKSNLISSRQILLFTYFITNGTFLGLGINYILNVSNNDSVIAAILGVGLGLLFILLFIKVTKHTKEVNIIKLNIKLMGNIFGNIINLILIIAAFIIGTISVWVITRYVGTQFLNNTPNYLIALLFIIPVVYLLFKGKETAGRTCEILFIISIFFYIISFFGLFNLGEMTNLKPYFKEGFFPILYGGFMYACFSGIPLFLLSIIPKNEIVDNKKYNKKVFIGYIMSCIAVVGVIFSIITILGIEVGKIFQYPEYAILKQITFFNFIEKIENILTIQWILDIFILTYFAHYFVKRGINDIFNVKKDIVKKSIIIVISILISIIPLLFYDKNPILKNFIFANYSYFLIGGLVIPFIITYIMIKVKRKQLNLN